MARTKYYKLGEKASMFYDTQNTLKVTKGVPGKTNNPTKDTIAASRSGHIIEINEGEYESMMAKLPELTRKAVLKEQKTANKEKPKAEPEKASTKLSVPEEDEDKSDSEEEEESSNDEERENLIKRVEKLDLSKKEKKKVLAMDNEDMEEYLNENEEED